MFSDVIVLILVWILRIYVPSPLVVPGFEKPIPGMNYSLEHPPLITKLSITSPILNKIILKWHPMWGTSSHLLLWLFFMYTN